MKKRKIDFGFLFRACFTLLCFYIILSPIISAHLMGRKFVLEFWEKNTITFLLAFLGLSFIRFEGKFISAISKIIGKK